MAAKASRSYLRRPRRHALCLIWVPFVVLPCLEGVKVYWTVAIREAGTFHENYHPPLRTTMCMSMSMNYTMMGLQLQHIIST